MLSEPIEDVNAALNCAGLFSQTVDPLLEACLETGTDYLDIAGRIELVESIAERKPQLVTATVE